MSRFFKWTCIFVLIWGVCPAFALERPQIHFDDRTWVIIYQGARGAELAVDFVPEGQTRDDWNEMVSTQFLIGMQDTLTISEYLDRAKRTVTGQCPAARWKTVRQSAEETMYEWNVDACKGVDDQSELTRVLRGEEGIHILRYVIKRSPLPAEKRSQWTKLLDETRLLKS